MRVRHVTCNLCGVRGTVEIKMNGGTIRVTKDRIRHRMNCPSRSKVPVHFRQKRWARQEKEANALVGARETLRSGAVNEDGDGRIFHEWRVEAKQTGKDYFLLTDRVWEKLCRGALEAGEEPLLHIQLGKIKLCAVRFCLIDTKLEELKRNKKSVRISTEIVHTLPRRVEASPDMAILTQKQFEELLCHIKS